MMCIDHISVFYLFLSSHLHPLHSSTSLFSVDLLLSVPFLPSVSVNTTFLIILLRLWFILPCLYGPRYFWIFKHGSLRWKELDRRSLAHTKHTSNTPFHPEY